MKHIEKRNIDGFFYKRMPEPLQIPTSNFTLFKLIFKFLKVVSSQTSDD